MFEEDSKDFILETYLSIQYCFDAISDQSEYRVLILEGPKGMGKETAVKKAWTYYYQRFTEKKYDINVECEHQSFKEVKERIAKDDIDILSTQRIILLNVDSFLQEEQDDFVKLIQDIIDKKDQIKIIATSSKPIPRFDNRVKILKMPLLTPEQTDSYLRQFAFKQMESFGEMESTGGKLI